MRRDSRTAQNRTGMAPGQKHKGGEDKLTQYPLTVAKIVSWFRSKQLSVEGSAVSLVHIREGDSGPKPGASADFDGAGTLGQICGWVSGEFDFHALRTSDGKDVLWRHVDVSEVDQLEEAYAEFLRTLQNPAENG